MDSLSRDIQGNARGDDLVNLRAGFDTIPVLELRPQKEDRIYVPETKTIERGRQNVAVV